MGTNAVHELLDQHKVAYEVHHHPRAVDANRLAQSEDITGWDVANAALFLASDEASFIAGVTLPVDGGASTHVARARLAGNALADLEVIFASNSVSSGSHHFGSRLAFDPQGCLYVTAGERGELVSVPRWPSRERAQQCAVRWAQRRRPAGRQPDGASAQSSQAHRRVADRVVRPAPLGDGPARGSPHASHSMPARTADLRHSPAAVCAGGLHHCARGWRPHRCCERLPAGRIAHTCR